uniref:Uncharacterized protein n=1 Tax=Cacopsylla melanoneura TaxID=428564 RepID=A0A8D8PP42_9HEMI
MFHYIRILGVDFLYLSPLFFVQILHVHRDVYDFFPCWQWHCEGHTIVRSLLPSLSHSRRRVYGNIFLLLPFRVDLWARTAGRWVQGVPKLVRFNVRVSTLLVYPLVVARLTLGLVSPDNFSPVDALQLRFVRIL